jgi:hypothetical protein
MPGQPRERRRFRPPVTRDVDRTWSRWRPSLELGGGAAHAAQFSETAGGSPPLVASEELENCTKAKISKGNSSRARLRTGVGSPSRY